MFLDPVRLKRQAEAVNTVTHALVPLLLAKGLMRGSHALTGKQLVGVGICGALPDLINPHLSLVARMSSWSHGLPAWLALTVILVVAAFIVPTRIPWRFVAAGSLAYLLHLCCDAISGGINWLSPVGDFVWGAYWFPPVLWIPSDITLVLVCYFVFRGGHLIAGDKG